MKQTTKMSRAVGQLEKIYFHLNEDFFDGTLSKDWNEIRIGRNSGFQPIRIGSTGTSQNGATYGGERRPSSTRKLKCPCCGNSVRATKNVRIMCMDCMQQMMEV